MRAVGHVQDLGGVALQQARVNDRQDARQRVGVEAVFYAGCLLRQTLLHMQQVFCCGREWKVA